MVQRFARCASGKHPVPLSRADVRADSHGFGVSDAAIEQRVAALSDGELATLSTQMQQLPRAAVSSC